jgi:hypothetical protein
MPISKKEFESGRILSQLEIAVITFLERHPDQAFTMNEIMDGINIQTDFRDFWKALASGIIILGFPSFLNNLATEGKIRINLIQGIYYYMSK